MLENSERDSRRDPGRPGGLGGSIRFGAGSARTADLVRSKGSSSKETDGTQANAGILVVEDEALNALYIASILEVCGYDVIGVAGTATEAIEAAATRVPDLVLMDITLRGELDGIAAAQYLKQQIDVPILFVTAHADAPTLARARAANPVGYLIKPFTAGQLEEAVREALMNPDASGSDPCPSGGEPSNDPRQTKDDDDHDDDTDDPKDIVRH